MIDPERHNFPTPTSEIRKNPLANWELLPFAVRPHYIQRVALVGPESCGKSYLAEKLAEHFQTVFVEEYGRTYCEKYGMDSTELDFAHVAGGQLYREDEMALQANRLLFCDTELIVTQVWSEIYFAGKCQPWIFWADHARRYDLFLLCSPDIPWVNDGLREYEGQREWMFERLRQELESRGLPYVIIRGGFEERMAEAVRVVAGLG
ncbi:MAG: AAA family ATPase [Lewinellaceae bacterium]|nr:AAA family ATPase [Lewinellaceae bacterium]